MWGFLRVAHENDNGGCAQCRAYRSNMFVGQLNSVMSGAQQSFFVFFCNSCGGSTAKHQYFILLFVCLLFVDFCLHAQVLLHVQVQVA